MPFLDRLARIIPYKEVPVLLYHRVSSSADQADRLVVTRRTFDRHMKYLYDKGFRTITLDEITEDHRCSISVSDRLIAITLDDGYLDTFSEAFPVLLKYGFTATVFVATGFMGKTVIIDSRVQSFLDWQQARTLIYWQNKSRSSSQDLSTMRIKRHQLT